MSDPSHFSSQASFDNTDNRETVNFDNNPPSQPQVITTITYTQRIVSSQPPANFQVEDTLLDQINREYSQLIKINAFPNNQHQPNQSNQLQKSENKSLQKKQTTNEQFIQRSNKKELNIDKNNVSPIKFSQKRQQPLQQPFQYQSPPKVFSQKSPTKSLTKLLDNFQIQPAAVSQPIQSLNQRGRESYQPYIPNQSHIPSLPFVDLNYNIEEILSNYNFNDDLDKQIEPIDETLYNVPEIVFDEQPNQNLTNYQEILQKMRQQVYGIGNNAQIPIENKVETVNQKKSETPPKELDGGEKSNNTKRISSVRMRTPPANRVTMIQNQFLKIIKDGKYNDERISKLQQTLGTLQGKKFHETEHLRDNQTEQNVQKQAISDTLDYLFSAESQTGTINAQHFDELKNYFEANMKRRKGMGYLRKKKQDIINCNKNQLTELKKQLANLQKQQNQINLERRKLDQEIQKMQAQSQKEQRQIKESLKQINYKKRRICARLGVEDFKLFRGKNMISSKGDNLDYYLQFNIRNQIFGKIRKRTEKAYPDVVIYSAFIVEQSELDYTYIPIKQRAQILKSTVIEEYARFKRTPLDTLLCISNQCKYLEKLQEQLQYAHCLLTVKSFKINQDVQTLSLVVESPSQDDIQIRIDLTKYNWTQHLKLKCYQKQNLVQKILEQSKSAGVERLRKIIEEIYMSLT